MVMKICEVCEKEFLSRTNTQKRCSRKCGAIANNHNDKEYRRNNADKIEAYRKEYYKKYYPANKDKLSKNARERAKANPEKYRAARNKWRSENPDKVLKMRALEKLRHYDGIENPPEELVAAIVEMRKIKRELKEQQS